MSQITSTARCWAGSKSVIKHTKNEPAVSRNFHQRAGSCIGAKLTPWLWIGGTKEVGTLGDKGEPVGHRRFAAIEGRGSHKGHVDRNQ